MKTSTKGGFSLRAIILITNIFKKKKINSCQRVAFILEAEKETSSRKGIALKIKVLFGKKQ